MCDTTHCRRTRSTLLACSYFQGMSLIFVCVTWLIHMCDMTHSYVWHDSFICVTWPTHMCDMTHSYVWNDSLICMTRLWLALTICADLWHIHKRSMTHSKWDMTHLRSPFMHVYHRHVCLFVTKKDLYVGHTGFFRHRKRPHVWFCI